MIFKTYISKFNTIVSNSKINTGLNPVAEIIRGRDFIISRSLIYFDHNKVKEMIDNGIMPNMNKMTHTLNITNGGSTDNTSLHDCGTSLFNDNKKIRAASFDLIFFLIPKPWDRGKGFDYTKTYLNVGYYSPTPIDPTRLISEQGSNWFNRENGLPWDEEGVYSNDTLSKEYDKWACGEESIVIGRQHFDYGNENISLDITSTFNKFITGELENNGIGIAFSPLLESTDDEYEQYVSLLTDKTNTFFEPFVETRYDDVISDDRSNFVLNKRNKLYLYCTIGDHLDDLDNLPKVTITDSNDEIVKGSDGEELKDIEAKRFSRGVYYIDLLLQKKDFEPNTMLYDTWDGLSYQGVELEPSELDFVLKDTPNFFNIGNSLETSDVTFTPSIGGIKENEEILRGDVRKLSILTVETYSTNTIRLIDEIYIRLYVKDGISEIDVISWDKVNKTFYDNFYLLDTSILIPQKYYVDIKVKYGMNSMTYSNILSFKIANDVKDKYH